MSKKNSREFGDALENFIIFLAQEYGVKLRKFTNSGAKNQNDSDFQDNYYQFECKRNGTNTKKGTNDLKFSTTQWNKLIKESRARNKKPAMINGCIDLNKSTVTIRLKDFLELYTIYLASLQEQK